MGVQIKLVTIDYFYTLLKDLEQRFFNISNGNKIHRVTNNNLFRPTTGQFFLCLGHQLIVSLSCLLSSQTRFMTPPPPFKCLTNSKLLQQTPAPNPPAPDAQLTALALSPHSIHRYLVLASCKKTFGCLFLNRQKNQNG